MAEFTPLAPTCGPCKEKSGTCFPGPCKIYRAAKVKRDAQSAAKEKSGG